MAQTIQFYDRPGGTLLLDVTPGQAGVQCSGAEFPLPPMRREVADNPGGDGGVVDASPYGLRTVHLPLVYTAGQVASPQVARRTAVAALLRVLLRERVWLAVTTHTGADPRYLNCYRAGDPDLVANIEGLGDRFAEITVDLLADPYAYGPKESLGTLSTTEAGNIKTTVAGSGVKGDAPAPLICTFTSDGTGNPASVWVASRVGGGVHKALCNITAASPGALPGTTTRTTISATSTLVGSDAIAWGNLPAAASEYVVSRQVMIDLVSGTSDVRLAGQYRVLLLLRWQALGASTNVFEAELRLPTPPVWSGWGAQQVLVSRTTTMAGTSGPPDAVVDLGIVQLPFGARPLHAGFDADAAVAPVPMDLYLRQLAPAVAGTEVWTDALVILPADDTMMLVQYADAGTYNGGTARTFTVDPHSGQVVVRQAGVNMGDVARVNYQGAPPNVVPGVNVDIYAFGYRGGLGYGAASYGAISTLPVSFTAEYWPRYVAVT